MMKRCKTLAVTMILLPLLSNTVLAQEKVVFALNWVPGGNHFGVFAAQEQGLYADAGLDVEIQRGYGSGDTVKRVATHTADFGIADAASVIVGRANDLDVKQVATIFARSADAIFYVKGRGISDTNDLEGKKIGASTGETTLKLLPLFCERANIDQNMLEIVNVTPSAKFASLMAGSVDAIVGFINEEPGIQKAAAKTGVEVGKFVFADYGVDYYSIGIIASDEAIANRPDILRRVVGATMQGYAWARRNSEAAADAFAERFPETSRDVALEQWNVASQLIFVDSTIENGLGYISDDKMQTTLDIISTYNSEAESVQASDVYTMDFLPKVPVD